MGDKPKLMPIIERFEKVQEKYSDFGACDTEANACFTRLMRMAVRGEVFPVVNVEVWELYSSKPGWKRAARSLTSAAKRAYRSIQKSTIVEVKELAGYYGWVDL